jgi:hypothetical protein
MLTLVLAGVAAVLAVVVLIQSKASSLLAWGVLALAAIHIVGKL